MMGNDSLPAPEPNASGRQPPTVLAEFVPTHSFEDVSEGSGIQLASGRWISNLDVAAWHEVGHAVGALGAGLHVFCVYVIPAHEVGLDPVLLQRTPPELWDVDPELDLWVGRCVPGVPYGFNPAIKHYGHALDAVAGSIAARAVTAGLGLPPGHFATEMSAGDRDSVEQAKEELGISPSQSAEFEQRLREQACRILVEHRREFGALVEALIAHKALAPFEILNVWRTGAFRFTGRIGEIPRFRRREDVTHLDWRRAPWRERFPCTAA